ncbi:sigma-70 family RNA polymerase sigma factor [bacterium]|nr:sigma-70 family RNA polymerase sigma factor [bacterium]
MPAEIEILENLIKNYKNEQDTKRKHILYLDLVEESMKLVRKIVSGVYPLPGSTTRDDLIQVGAVGVLKAIDTYNVQKKGSFKTYVSKFIKGKILHYMRDKANIVRPPRETVENIKKVKEAIREIVGDDSKIPPVEEISKYVNLPEEKISEILSIESIKNMISLDQNIYSNEGVETLVDRIQAEEGFEETFENKKMIEFALSKLPNPDKIVISDYYLKGVPRKEIAEKFGVSTTQISRILKRALHKLYIIIENEASEVQVK